MVKLIVPFSGTDTVSLVQVIVQHSFTRHEQNESKSFRRFSQDLLVVLLVFGFTKTCMCSLVFFGFSFSPQFRRLLAKLQPSRRQQRANVCRRHDRCHAACKLPIVADASRRTDARRSAVLSADYAIFRNSFRRYEVPKRTIYPPLRPKISNSSFFIAFHNQPSLLAPPLHRMNFLQRITTWRRLRWLFFRATNFLLSKLLVMHIIS